MGIFDITYSIQTDRLIPPNKRMDEIKQWMYALVKPLQWLSDMSISSYRLGFDASAWDNSTAYDKEDRVKWLDGSIYEALEDTNAGDAPVGSGAEKWYKILDIFVGANERVLFNGQKTILEYALNKFMGTNFEQPQIYPPDPLIFSEIYIVNEDTDDNSFLIGSGAPDTSFIADNPYLMDDFIGDGFSAEKINFTVYYPTAFTTNQVYRLTAYTEKYKLYGTTAAYVPY